MKIKTLIVTGALILGTLSATTVFASAVKNGNESQPATCNINHVHEDYSCISLEVQDYWNTKQINAFNTIAKERDEYIKYLKAKGYEGTKLLNAIEGYDHSLRWTEEVFSRDVFEAKDADIKTEVK